jgi:hypothetical protein
VIRRRCGEDCTWGAPACEFDLNSCAYWFLPEGAREWKRFPVDPGATFAPTEPVIAAIGLTPQQRVYAFTKTQYHVFATGGFAWVTSGPRSDLFPQLGDDELFHASAIATEPPNSIVTIVAGQTAYSYTYHGQDSLFNFDAVTPCCGEDWQGPNAPPNPFSAVRDSYARLGDPEGWIDGDPESLCGLNDPTPVYAYSAAIGDGSVYPQDIGFCFDFYSPVPFAQFPPFSYPGAPPNELIGGAAWLDGLYIFRGE